jgi:hypothetical protein
MNQKGTRNARQPNTTLIPPIDFNIGGAEDVFPENDRV